MYFILLFENVTTFLNKEASKYFSNVIKDTIKLRIEKNIIRPDIINIILEARKDGKSEDKRKRTINISNNEITSQVVLFFFQEEIWKTVKDGKVTYEDLQQMRYMEMFISETPRKWPLFPFVDRLCVKPYTIQPSNENEKPIYIKKDMEVWLPTFGLHRDPKYFPNPKKFDPGQFSNENKHKIPPYVYIPFGIGPRLCIGNRFALVEFKILFFHLLLNYEIILTSKTPKTIVLNKDFQLSEVGGFPLGLKSI